jgi:D-alanyl-D-alanine carboxypeptidase
MNARTKDETLAFIARGKPDFEPGEKRSYSNSAFVLLGYIVEKLDGKPYQDALKKRITGKLGLKDTYARHGKDRRQQKGKLFLQLRRRLETARRNGFEHSGRRGRDHFDAERPRPNSFRRSLTASSFRRRVSQMKPIKDKYGSGIILYQKLDGKTFYGHGGGIDGFSSLLIYLPEEKLALAYSTNGKVYPATKIVSGVFDIYQNKPFEIPL